MAEKLTCECRPELSVISVSDTNKGVFADFFTNGGARSMSCNHQSFLVQCINSAPDGLFDIGVITVFEISPPDRSLEQRVPSDEKLILLKQETHGTGRMAGRMKSHSATATQTLRRPVTSDPGPVVAGKEHRNVGTDFPRHPRETCPACAPIWSHR